MMQKHRLPPSCPQVLPPSPLQVSRPITSIMSKHNLAIGGYSVPEPTRVGKWTNSKGTSGPTSVYHQQELVPLGLCFEAASPRQRNINVHGGDFVNVGMHYRMQAYTLARTSGEAMNEQV